MSFKIGSLFDGSGGFPLAAFMCGGIPTWAAEIEPYPIAVTKSRFPMMKHLGSVTDINGRDVEPVDIITFGSPCQDLSVAGKRAGLKHEANGDEETTRSGLFMEAVRIIKEMREATNGRYPTFALWENVPGAFSSNKGEDFRTVCEELIHIVEPTAVMPEVPKNGWAYADVYCGNGWSLAYRVFDAQYWGVPQRRRRIYALLDLRGERAGKILFEREGLRGYFTKGRTPRQTASADAQGSFGAADTAKCFGISSYASNAMKSNNPHSGIYEADTSRTLDLNGGNPACNQGGIMVVEPVGVDMYNLAVTGEVATTLTTATGQGSSNTGPSVAVPYTLKIRSGCEGGGKGALIQEDKSATLATNNDQYLFQAVSIENHPADSRVNIDTSGKVQTLTSRMGTGGGNVPMVMEPKAIYTHPQSDTWTFEKENRVQTLAAGMGMGGGNTPLVMEPVVYDGAGVTSPVNASNPSPGDPCHTLSTDSRNLLVERVICLQGNGIDRADTAGCNGKGWNDKSCYTLNTIDRPAVVYAIDQQGGKGGANYAENVMPTLCSDSHGTPHGVVYAVDQGGGKSGANVSEDTAPTLCTTHGGEPAVAYCTDIGWWNTVENAAPTLLARQYKDPHLVCYWDGSQTVGTLTANNAGGNQRMPDKENFNCVIDQKPICYRQGGFADYVEGEVGTLRAAGGDFGGGSENLIRTRYIVRRLTPTECARLQGFPDKWGHPEWISEDVKGEAPLFWRDVYMMDCAIKGKKPKPNIAEMQNGWEVAVIRWHNKLHSDSNEYKMWGNGIALPCALYVMEGVSEAMK